MKITLTCVNFREGLPPNSEAVVLPTNGGTIGRSPDNELVIPDPDHYASRQHARIFVEESIVLVENNSSNGTLINGSVEMTVGQRHSLDDGDTLEIGECTIQVNIGEVLPTSPEPDELDEIDLAFADLDMDDQPTLTAMTGSANSPPPDEQQSVNSADSEAIGVFLNELQIDPDSLDRDIVPVMRIAGVVLRTLTQGVMEMLKGRKTVKKSFDMDTTRLQGAQNNAFKFSGSPDEALSLLLKEEKGYLDPIQSVEEAVNDAKAHQVAMVSGMNAVIQTIIARFDPQALEEELDKGFTFSRKARYWETYTENYQQMAKEYEDDINALFAEEFRKTYELQVRAFKK